MPYQNNTSKKDIYNTLSRFVPSEAAHFFVTWIIEKKIHLKITPNRKTKAGTYQAPHPTKKQLGHKITVNGDLGRIRFCITFIHELAHLLVWENYKNTVQPHGKEWKNCYKTLMLEFIKETTSFPINIEKLVIQHVQNPPSSTSYDTTLLSAIDEYEGKIELRLKDVEEGKFYLVENKLVLRKLKLLRKYYLCEEQNTKKQFRVHPNATVKEI